MRRALDPLPLEVATRNVGLRGRGVRLQVGERIPLLALLEMGYGVRPLARAMKLSPTTVIAIRRSARPIELRQAASFARRIQKRLAPRQRVRDQVFSIQERIRSGSADPSPLASPVLDLAQRWRRRIRNPQTRQARADLIGALRSN